MPYSYSCTFSPHCKGTVMGPYMKFFAFMGVSTKQLYASQVTMNKLSGDLGEVICMRH